MSSAFSGMAQQRARVLASPRSTALAKLASSKPVQAALQSYTGGQYSTSPLSSNETTSGKRLPTRLQAGIAALSGVDVSDVEVVRNSSLPAQLQAHAFAQGRKIHLAAGQERHLPHEAWHVVQQQQGRVKADSRLAGQAANQNPALESEAGKMGERAMQLGMSAGVAQQPGARASAQASRSNMPVQLVSYGASWSSQQQIYQANKVGTQRLPGDAEWLAIQRYCAGVTNIASTDTVNDVLAKAKALKGVSFQDWKGSQSTGDSQEAQHLISASYATKVLKLPYRLINSKENGKMLLAGRGNKGSKVPPKYAASKKIRKKPIARGLRHIKKGIAHPHYEKRMKAYVAKFYQAKKLKIGGAISDAQFKQMANFLRMQHKKHDGKISQLGVDDIVF